MAWSRDRGLRGAEQAAGTSEEGYDRCLGAYTLWVKWPGEDGPNRLQHCVYCGRELPLGDGSWIRLPEGR